MKQKQNSPFSNVFLEKNLTVNQAINQLLPVICKGMCLLLYGDMGVGKTYFTIALCEKLKIAEHPSSPTYTLVNEYTCSNLNILHVDLYRIKKIDDFLTCEIYDPNKLSIIEWAQRLETEWAQNLKINPKNIVKVYFKAQDQLYINMNIGIL